MDGTIGTILMWAMNWAPTNWAICDGSLLSISQNTALFSLIGTSYGGNGTSNFALPDLRGRLPIGMGQGPGLSLRTLGELTGTEQVTLTAANMPPHSHNLTATNTPNANLTQAPANNWSLGAAASVSGDRPPVITPVSMYTSTPQGASVPSAPTSVVGSGIPVENMPPVLCVNFIICVAGIYPSRP